jgi:hypothetical protein
MPGHVFVGYITCIPIQHFLVLFVPILLLMIFQQQNVTLWEWENTMYFACVQAIQYISLLWARGRAHSIWKIDAGTRHKSRHGK